MSGAASADGAAPGGPHGTEAPGGPGPWGGGNPAYTRFHPRWHRRRMPIFWWLRKFSYVRFIARELTSIAVAYAALLLIVQAWFLSGGPGPYEAFREWLMRPWVVVLHALIFLNLLYHAGTWLNLTPKALVLRVGRMRVPDLAVILAHWGGWVIVSAAVWWFLGGGSP